MSAAGPDVHSPLRVACESPARVRVHDRAGWLALFAVDGVVEDPVGSAPHRGLAALGRFYDTFIGPNDVVMQSALDVTHPSGMQVARDVVIHTTMSTGLAIDVHAYLLYELVTDDNGLRIGRLAAHWDLPRMSLHVMTRGLRGLWTLTMTTVHMLRHQGVGGVLGYMRGMTHGMFGRGTRAVARLADAISQRDVGRLAALLSPDACVDLIVPAHAAPAAATSPPALTAPAARLLASLPAGAQFTVDSALSSGFTVAFRYACPSDGGPRAQPAPHGIGFCTFSSQATRGQRAITVLRLFPTPSAP